MKIDAEKLIFFTFSIALELNSSTSNCVLHMIEEFCWKYFKPSAVCHTAVTIFHFRLFASFCFRKSIKFSSLLFFTRIVNIWRNRSTCVCGEWISLWLQSENSILLLLLNPLTSFYVPKIHRTDFWNHVNDAAFNSLIKWSRKVLQKKHKWTLNSHEGDITERLTTTN